MNAPLSIALAYSVGNETLDRQHQKLLELCREVELANDLSEGRDGQFNSVLDELCRYAEEHFRDEEEYLQAGGFPDFATHKKMHDEFISGLSQIVFNASKGKLETRQLHEFLNVWMINHILDADMKYRDYFSRA